MEAKLRLYLSLEWIFDRLAHERSFRVFSHHPVRAKTFHFLQSQLLSEYRVLDLGCGTGDLSFQIAGHVKSVVALDHNPTLVAWATKHHTAVNLSFQNADADAYLSINRNDFDVLILSHILEHLDEPESFLGRFTSYFRHVYIEVPDLERTPLNEYRQKLNVQLQYSDTDHIWEFDRDDMMRLILGCGLKILASEFRFGVQKYWCERPLGHQ